MYNNHDLGVTLLGSGFYCIYFLICLWFVAKFSNDEPELAFFVLFVLTVVFPLILSGIYLL